MSVGERGQPTFAEASRFFAWLGCVNFGGPAAQIPLLHQELVERRRWISGSRFFHALNYCMLLPGPEAMQLATYVGWLLHGVRGGVIAGTFFVLPGALLIWLLAIVYVNAGDLAWVQGAFRGLGPAVVAIVAVAGVRLVRKTLRHGLQWALAVGAFGAIAGLHLPFPVIVLGAAAVGLLAARTGRPLAVGRHGPEDGGAGPEIAAPLAARSLRVLVAHVALWAAPLAALALTPGCERFLQVGLFFSLAAVVTFGGAYAVLAFLAQVAVERYAWLSAHDMTVSLGLAESTPGPLILVVEFVGFLAGHGAPPPGWSALGAASFAAALTLWVTFVPCFLWILLGAPYIERLRGRAWLDSMLGAVSAAVVGVVAHLAVFLGLRVLFADVAKVAVGPLLLPWPRWSTLDGLALAVLCAGVLLLVRWRCNVLVLVLAAATLGAALRGLGLG